MRPNRVAHFVLPAGIAAILFCADAVATCTSTLPDNTLAVITCSEHSDVLTLSQANGNWYHAGLVAGTGAYDWDSNADGTQYLQAGAQIDVVFPAGARLDIGNDETAAVDLVGAVTLANPTNTSTVVLESFSSSPGSTYNIDDLPGVTTVNELTFSTRQSAGFDLTISAGKGSDRVNVLSTSSLDTIGVHGNAGVDDVFIGDAGNARKIWGPVAIFNDNGFTNITVDDSADFSARTATLTSTSINGLTPSAIAWSANDVGIVTLHFSPANDTLNVRSIGNSGPTALNVLGTAGIDTIAIGDAGSVQSVKAPVALIGGSGEFDVTVDDHSDYASRNVTYSERVISGLGPAVLRWSKITDIHSLTVHQGDGGNLVHVLGTPLAAATSLDLGNGSNRCYVNGQGLVAFSTTITGGDSDDLFVVSPVSSPTFTLNINGGSQTAGDEIVYTGHWATGGFPGNGTLTPTDPDARPIHYTSIELFSVGDWIFSAGFE